MITPNDCIRKYGNPTPEFERAYMVVWSVPDDIHVLIEPLPKKIYCNKDLIQPLWNALLLVINRNLAGEIKEWGGCFAIRNMRGSKNPSIHSWGIAFDINPSTNRLGQMPEMSINLVACFEECGFDWGGFWSRKDGMHFQLKKI